MTLPLIVLAILSVIGGFINLPHIIGHGAYSKLAEWLNPLINLQAKHQMEANLQGVDFNTEMILLGLTIHYFLSKQIYLPISRLRRNSGDDRKRSLCTAATTNS